MKNLMEKLQKHERSIAAVVFCIGIAMILLYVYAAALYINSETEVLEQKLSAISIEGTGEIYTADYSLDIQTDETTGEEIIASFDLDAITSIKQVDGKYIIITNTGVEYTSFEFLDDDGNMLTAYTSDGELRFENVAGAEVEEFTVNTHLVTMQDGVLYADGYALQVSNEEATTTTTTTKATTTTTTTTTTTSTTTSKSTTKATTTTTKAAAATTQATTQATTKATTKATTTTTTTKATTTTTTIVTYTPSGDAAEVLKLVNAERKKYGLSELKAIVTLDQAALVRAREVVSVQDHVRPDGRSISTVLSDYGLSFSYMGENIACGSASAEEVVSDWMNSANHKANILNANYEYMGLGHVYVSNDSNNYYDYWVQLFYTPL